MSNTEATCGSVNPQENTYAIECFLIFYPLLLPLPAESFVGKGRVFKGMRRHARGRFGRVEYKHCHYFLRLEEGEPPQQYYLPEPQTPQEQYEHWVQQMRSRKVINSL